MIGSDVRRPVLFIGKLGYKRCMLAVVHELLHTIPAMLRDNEPYRPPDIDYQALVVHRNAACWLAKPEPYGYLQAIPSATDGQAP